VSDYGVRGRRKIAKKILVICPVLLIGWWISPVMWESRFEC
jgi:hypothetical protein